MTLLPHVPEQTDALLIHLSKKLPAYKVYKRFGNIQVKTRSITLTGIVNIKPYKKMKKLKVTTNYDMRMLYWFFNWPIAIYLTVKKDKQLGMESEVVAHIKEFTKENIISKH